MDLSLYEKLCEYNKLKRASFHTPGHKGIRMFNQDMIKFDVTELEETDDLYNPKGAILQSEIEMQRVLNTKRTIFSAGGNTLCIQSMIALSVPVGGKVIISRNVHKSVITTLALLDITPIWIKSDNKNYNYLPNPIVKEDIEQRLSGNKGISAVLITSPDYYGTISDIKGISEICKKYNVPLLVDNAHGSHLKYLKNDLHPISMGASMTADSLHKTMPVMTGGAMLNISDQRFIDRSKEIMGIFGSTSPSYAIMASIDLCRKWLYRNGRKAYSELEERVDEIKNIAYNKGFEYNKLWCDPVRITLNTNSIGYKGNDLKKYFNDYKIEPEYCNDTHIILIPSPFNSDEDWKRLKKAIQNIKVLTKINYDFMDLKIPKMRLPIRKALFSDSEIIDIGYSKGRIAAEIICPCPPGVPLTIPGEEVDDYTKQLLINYGIYKIKVVK